MFIALVVLTVLSRLGYLNLAGVSVVVSHSMEPSIRRFDLVLYANTSYETGDVIVYCVTPSHCYVHRVIGFMNLSTVNGNEVRVLTKGDNTNVTDSPVHLDWVKGKVVSTVPREIWVPIVLFFIATTLYSMVRVPIIGVSYVFVFMVGMTSILAVFALVPPAFNPVATKVYSVHLSGVYLDYDACTAIIRYTGDLYLSNATVHVDSAAARVLLLGEREIVFEPSKMTLEKSFRTGIPVSIEVHAVLNNVGSLYGRYELLVGGKNPEISWLNGVVLIRNPNCFPMRIRISLKYYDEEFKWSNSTHVVDGFSYITVEPPHNARYAYVYIYWFNRGEERWIGIPLKNW